MMEPPPRARIGTMLCWAHSSTPFKSTSRSKSMSTSVISSSCDVALHARIGVHDV